MTGTSQDTVSAIDDGAEPMARVKPPVPPGTELARARLLAALFDDRNPGPRFGRFRVITRLGAGGMGVVYEAYDPDLARGVALKLVDVASVDRDSALAEAKALARLSHPHVVPIFDVGFEGRHVYLVMELVRGETLRSWPRGRTVREIVAAYQQAGAALAAAHEAGLVHRDFKPDNAIVGADRRVRVVDFGLACEAEDPRRASTLRQRAAGTPGFIAPELATGAPITAAADQYSFCVALTLALQLAHGAPPRWVAAAVARGRATDPAQRHASMAALLRALGRDPARQVRRGVAVAALAAAVGVGAFALGQGRGDGDPCQGGPQRIAQVWPEATRAVALQRVAGLGPGGPAAHAVLARQLGGYVRRWIAEDGAACRASRDGTQTELMSERRLACLRRSGDALAAVRALVEAAESARLFELPRAVQAMQDPAACGDRDALGSEVAPPPTRLAPEIARLRQDVERARVLLGAGRAEQAGEVARATAAHARAVAYAPLLAEALLVEGQATMMQADRAPAIAALVEASRLGLEAGAYPVAIEAWARRAWAQGTTPTQRRGEALAGLDLIEPLARRTAAATFARALLFNNIGGVMLADGRVAEARGWFTRALDEAHRVAGRGAPELINIKVNLAVATADHAQGDALIAEGIAELTEQLGADHPDTLNLRQHRALVTTERVGQVEAGLAPVCAAEAGYPDLASRTATCWSELSAARADLGDAAGAIAALERARRLDPGSRELAGTLALLTGDAAGAAGQFAAGLVPHAADEPWWRGLERGRLALGLGRAQRALGQRDEARRSLDLAVAELAAVTANHTATSFAGWLGRARLERALCLAELKVRTPDSAANAAAVNAWLERTGAARRGLAR